MKIISRSAARKLGFKRFFTGEPCKNNHISERTTTSSVCHRCDADRKQEIRRINPEKNKEIAKKSRLKHAQARRDDNKRWREKNAAALKISKKKYVEDNREKVANAKNKYYLDNKEKCLALSKKHHAENKEHYAYLNKKWRENNRDQVRLNNRNRKKKIKEAEGSHTVKDINNIFNLQFGKCAACYEKLVNKNYHVDHIQPLALGGSNFPRNLQILCPPCNMSKGAKPPEEFYILRGFLL